MHFRGVLTHHCISCFCWLNDSNADRVYHLPMWSRGPLDGGGPVVGVSPWFGRTRGTNSGRCFRYQVQMCNRMQCHELPQLPGLPVAEATGARQECMVRVCGGPAARCQRLDKVQQHCFRHDGADVNRLRRVLSAAALLARVYSDDTVTLVRCATTTTAPLQLQPPPICLGSHGSYLEVHNPSSTTVSLPPPPASLPSHISSVRLGLAHGVSAPNLFIGLTPVHDSLFGDRTTAMQLLPVQGWRSAERPCMGS